jgi:hypothetical protein
VVNPSETVTVAGTITNANTGALVANGTAVTPPPGSSWSFKFSGLSDGVAYNENVKVTAADGSANSATIGITCTSP